MLWELQISQNICSSPSFPVCRCFTLIHTLTDTRKSAATQARVKWLGSHYNDMQNVKGNIRFTNSLMTILQHYSMAVSYECWTLRHGDCTNRSTPCILTSHIQQHKQRKAKQKQKNNSNAHSSAINFGYGLFNDTLYNSDYVLSDGRINDYWMNWKGCGIKQLWPNFSYYSGIYLEELRKIMKNESGWLDFRSRIEPVTS
jgi:hypothetical protein